MQHLHLVWSVIVAYAHNSEPLLRSFLADAHVIINLLGTWG
jgi:hypothetical protein